MVKPRSPHTKWAIALLVGLTATAYAVSLDDGPTPVAPVSRSEAEGVLRDAVRLARSGDLAGLCQSVADVAGICLHTVEGTRQSGQHPAETAPTIVGERRQADMLVLEVAGTRTDGTGYHADFGVLRTDSGPRGFNPVYWSGVRIGTSRPCADTPPNAVCARSESSPGD
ncbi:hypothetical protein V5P93_006666 [Actinokineospora auranticolor]|uniref:Uncharacterized protein n=1 Tax=Actinokineospora auranticolor TaxID=155976 RepID=A0A2S6GX09_9PSEU|nr:hypothetical protein [Actinokineospora auranticolor]PPK69691.1 hypothetical protein CLV40_103301 [Actinokineospora auranticolor]